MTKIRIAVAVAAVALLSSAARAEDGAWSSKYGMLFTVENVFGNNQPNTLGGLGGSVGLQYNLGPERALRLQVSLSRASQDATETKTTDLATGQVTTSFSAPLGYTSRYDVGLGAAYMMRLGTAAVAPYLGAGGGIGYSQNSLKWENTTGAVNTIGRDWMTRTMTLGAQGILGLEWRLHKSMALFAEYALDVDLVSNSSTTNEDTTTVKATGAVSGTRVKSSGTTFFNFNTGIGQGGMIGLLAFF